MSAAKMLLSDLNRRGIRLAPDGDGLIAEPASALTDSDRASIRTLKSGLVAYLRYARNWDDEEGVWKDDIWRADGFSGPKGKKIQVSPYVSFVLNQNTTFGCCDNCGEPAGLVVPWQAAISGARRFCGVACYQAMLGRARVAPDKKKNTAAA